MPNTHTTQVDLTCSVVQPKLPAWKFKSLCQIVKHYHRSLLPACRPTQTSSMARSMASLKYVTTNGTHCASRTALACNVCAFVAVTSLLLAPYLSDSCKKI